MVEKEPKLKGRQIMLIVLAILLLLVLLLIPFVVVAGHVYNFNVPVLVVDDFSPPWVLKVLLPLGAILWFALIALEWLGSRPPSKVALTVFTILGAITLLPYIIMMVVVYVLGVLFVAFLYVAFWWVVISLIFGALK
ncbi:hypothetical protein M1545_02960 [Patescibacteria group bacterium]|nr:hypothetical protein [Patescibacteria group bacterium]